MFRQMFRPVAPQNPTPLTGGLGQDLGLQGVVHHGHIEQLPHQGLGAVLKESNRHKNQTGVLKSDPNWAQNHVFAIYYSLNPPKSGFFPDKTTVLFSHVPNPSAFFEKKNGTPPGLVHMTLPFVCGVDRQVGAGRLPPKHGRRCFYFFNGNIWEHILLLGAMIC